MSSGMSTTSFQDSDNSHFSIFLPKALVILVLKVAEKFKFRSIDEFAILDSFHQLFYKISRDGSEGDMDEKTVALMITNLMRIAEKQNRAKSPMLKEQMDKIFPNIEITKEEFDKYEFKVFKMMNFRLATPVAAEYIFHLIKAHMPEVDAKEKFFEFCLDILRIVYSDRKMIFETLSETFGSEKSENLKRDQKLMGAAVFIAVLKVTNTSDRVYNNIFYQISTNSLDDGDCEMAFNMNQLAAIIFNLIKDKKISKI